MKKILFLTVAAAMVACCGSALAQAAPAGEPDGVWLADVLPGGEQFVELASAELPDGNPLMELAAGDVPRGAAGPEATAESLQGPPEMGAGPMRHGFGFGPMAGGPGAGPGARWMQFRGMRGPQGMRMGAMMMRAAQAIGLTEEQMNRLRGMRVAHQREMIRLRADAQIARLDLEEALRQPNAKFPDVKAKIAAITAIQGQMMEKHISFRMDAKGVLTAEQQEKLRGLMMGRGMGGWGPGAGMMGHGGWGQGQKGAQPEPKK
jgi:hypothetical protein